MTKSRNSRRKAAYYRALIGSALVGTSLSQMALPVLAQITPAGQNISNTATATYENPEDPNDPFTTESNEVIITVAKVAGITNTPAGTNNLGVGGTSDAPGPGAGGTVLTNHVLEFLFDVTNTGNDRTNIFIPNAQNITTTGLSSSSLIVEISTDGGTTFVPRPNDGIIEDVGAGDSIIVKVTGTVTATSAGAPVSVRLGNTGNNQAPNAPEPGTQNQADAQDGNVAGDDEVRTENATNPLANNVAPDPANGQREASATNQLLLGSNPKAMVKIRKVNESAIVDSDNDNKYDVTYNLNLEVSNTSPSSLYVPGSLTGRDYSLNNGERGEIDVTGSAINENTNLILISDAIPEGTTLKENSVLSPNNWVPVYTSDDLITLPTKADWTTDINSLTLPITRIGWVYDANANVPIAPGTVVQGNFSFTVTTDFDEATGGTVANIAQVFGNTEQNNTPVFDESGDNNPANLNDDGTDGPGEDDPLSDGVANPAEQGVDLDNNNTGTGPGGEVNLLDLNPPGTILNGPANRPAAEGDVFGGDPDPNNNEDFQNVATAPTGGVSDPDSVPFTNTLQNPSDQPLTNILLQPIQPSALGGEDDALPTDTEVTITFGNQTATYIYDGSVFTLISGEPITIPSLNAGVQVNYTVSVDLPAGTQDSTFVDGDGNLQGGYPVPIVAYQNNDNSGNPLGDDGLLKDVNTSNATVNQVYKGFLKLIKQVQVLRPVNPDDPNTTFTVRDGMGFSAADTAKLPQPGDKLEYRVIYRNISEPQSGSGTNVILNANNVQITEDGTGTFPADSDNNWAEFTLNVQNSATDNSSGSTINYFIGDFQPNGTIDTGDNVTGYRVTIPQVIPSGIPTGTFSDLNSIDPTQPGYRFFRFNRLVQ